MRPQPSRAQESRHGVGEHGRGLTRAPCAVTLDRSAGLSKASSDQSRKMGVMVRLTLRVLGGMDDTVPVLQRLADA